MNNKAYQQALLNMVAQIVPTFGRVFVCANSSDTDEENYQRLQETFEPVDGIPRFYTSLETAEGIMESNNNDVCLLDANSAHVLASGLALTENRKNFIGMDGGDRLIQQGTKIQTTDAAAVAYVLKNTGTRNSFRNIKFIMNDTDSAALNVVQMGGEGNIYKNCSFTFGVNDNLGDTSASEVVCGEDSGSFIDCEFGTETLLTTDARSVFTIDQVTAGQEFKSNRFIRPTFLISSSSAAATLLSIIANTDALFTNLMRDPVFMASVDSAGGVAITNAVKSISGLVKGTINFGIPQPFNCTNFSASESAGFQVAGTPTATTNAFEGVTPA